MVGPSADSKGGIATVISNFKNYPTSNSVTYLDSWKEVGRLKTGTQAFFSIKKKASEVDIVHFHVAQKGSFYRKSILASRVPKETKIIFHMHASQFDTFYENSSSLVKRSIRKTLDSLDKLVVLSEEWAQFYQTITSTEIIIIKNAVEVPDRIQYDSRSKKIITLGKICERKGSYDILTLAERIFPIFPEIRFILYGDGEIEKIKKQIKKRRINNVYIGGWITKPEQKIVMKGSLLHLLPSYQEGLPMSILETMSFGISNLTTTVGGIPQVVKDSENSMAVYPGDIDAMFKKLSYFLENRNVREFYSTEANKTIQDHFSLNLYFEKWDKFYRNLD